MEPENQEQEIEMNQEPLIINTQGGAVNSVNGQTGDVVLTTSDLENDSGYQNGTQVENAIETAIGQIEIPTKTSDLDNDGEDGTSTYVEASDLAKVATTGDYDDLIDKPTIPIVNDATLTITQNGTSKGTFTANDADDTTIEVSDTTYSNFTGTDGVSAGTSGLVPAPATTDAGKFLKADGTWDTAGGGGPTVVQNTGTSTTDVMSQNAVSSTIFADPGTDTKIKIGLGASVSSQSDNMAIGHSADANGLNTIAIGANASSRNGGVALGISAKAGNSSSHTHTLALGYNAQALGTGAIALGRDSSSTHQGEMNIGTSNTSFGYNSTNYRLLSGVHDGQLANDAVTVGQLNATIDAINTALSTNIPHVGA